LFRVEIPQVVCFDDYLLILVVCQSTWDSLMLLAEKSIASCWWLGCVRNLGSVVSANPHFRFSFVCWTSKGHNETNANNFALWLYNCIAPKLARGGCFAGLDAHCTWTWYMRYLYTRHLKRKETNNARLILDQVILVAHKWDSRIK
jgi:hypothetical protein